ncbi:MAG TPA: cytochrome b [Gammaproteobacteria bacterium]
MQLRNSKTGFGLVAQLLHWLIAALILGQFVLARLAADATFFERLVLLSRHKSLGMTILALTILRLIWRLTNPRPSTPHELPRYQHLIARTSHDLMYFLIFAIPLTGWAMSSALNTPVSYFGLFAWPNLVAPDQQLGERLARTHGGLFAVLAGVVCLHAGAALYHHFVARNNVLRRMIPGVSP